MCLVTSYHITYLELGVFIGLALLKATLCSNLISLISGLWNSLIGWWGHGAWGEGVLYLGTDKKTN